MRRHLLNALYRRTRLAASGLLDAQKTAKGINGLQCQASGAEQQYFYSISAGLLAAAAVASSEICKSDFQAARCAAELPLPSANPKADQFIDEFRHWLRRIGGDTSGIDIKSCSEVQSSVNAASVRFLHSV